MNKHTPGPWRLTDDHKTRRVIKGGLPESSIVIVEDWTREEDARLIAAAPDLLEALREIADGCMNLRPGHVDADKNRTKAQIEEIARAAIAKAEGA